MDHFDLMVNIHQVQVWESRHHCPSRMVLPFIHVLAHLLLISCTAWREHSKNSHWPLSSTRIPTIVGKLNHLLTWILQFPEIYKHRIPLAICCTERVYGWGNAKQRLAYSPPFVRLRSFFCIFVSWIITSFKCTVSLSVFSRLRWKDRTKTAKKRTKSPRV